jgi:hypothetical protein
MSDQSNFKDDEIREHLRRTQTRRKDVDYDQMQAQRDILLAARTNTPEEFMVLLTNRGIDLNSAQGCKVMEAYWAIRRGLQR